jgi:hypothetical protein
METVTKALPAACKELEEDLVLYYYGEAAVSDRKALENHIATCSRCRGFLDDLNTLLPSMAKAKELPPTFWDNYYREVVEKITDLDEKGLFGWRKLIALLQSWAVPAMATAAVLVLGVTLTLNKTSFERPSDIRDAMIPQEILADANRVEFFKSMELVESLRALEALDGSNPKSKDVRSL